jgi:hypothetical protein
MIVTDKASAANWLTAVAVAIAGALPVWQAVTEFGWLGIAFGRLSPVFWAMILIYIVCVACVLWWQRRWWVLITAPIVLYPVLMAGAVLGSCARGDCF